MHRVSLSNATMCASSVGAFSCTVLAKQKSMSKTGSPSSTSHGGRSELWPSLAGFTHIVNHIHYRKPLLRQKPPNSPQVRTRSRYSHGLHKGDFLVPACVSCSSRRFISTSPLGRADPDAGHVVDLFRPPTLHGHGEHCVPVIGERCAHCCRCSETSFTTCH